MNERAREDPDARIERGHIFHALHASPRYFKISCNILHTISGYKQIRKILKILINYQLAIGFSSDSYDIFVNCQFFIIKTEGIKAEVDFKIFSIKKLHKYQLVSKVYTFIFHRLLHFLL